MRYQIGRPGRIIVARFEDREDVMGNLVDIAKKEKIMSAVKIHKAKRELDPVSGLTLLKL